MSQRASRRDFLRHSVAAAWFVGFSATKPAWAASKSPNEKLNLAIIGCGNKGGHNVDQLTAENMVALCDVDSNYLNMQAQRFTSATKYSDYREMLDKEAKHIDAVVVSTADHTHAPATAAAISLGKHVYCEKPLTHTVREARTIAELAAKHKVATQMGTQIHAENNYRRVVEVIQSGAIGKVTEVYNWCNKGWSDGRFGAVKPVPANLDWDSWLGPAKFHEYCDGIHPGNWRRFWEYGSGTFGDMAAHVMDLPFWALGLRHPTSVKCEGPAVHPDGAPAWVKAIYEFPARGDQPAVKFHWSDGNAHFDKVKNLKDADGKSYGDWGLGILFVGDKGMLIADYGRYVLLPTDKFAGFTPPKQTIPNSIGHWKEWTQACKTGSPTLCNFDYAGALTETILLGIVAFRSGETVEWDAVNLKAKNSKTANNYISKDYRKGWEVAGLT
jgi:predicted dehydrogenase